MSTICTLIVGIQQQAVALLAISLTLCVTDILVVPCANHERSVLLVQLNGLFVCLWVCISWFVAAARGECEDYDQEKEKFCLFHIAYFDIFKPSLADGVLPL